MQLLQITLLGEESDAEDVKNWLLACKSKLWLAMKPSNTTWSGTSDAASFNFLLCLSHTLTFADYWRGTLGEESIWLKNCHNNHLKSKAHIFLGFFFFFGPLGISCMK